MRIGLMALAGAVILTCTVASVGCATKKHVRAQIQPLEQRISAVESKATEQAASIGLLKQDVSRADERALGADSKAQEAALAAKQAQETAVKSGELATSSGEAAGRAQSLAERGLAKAAWSERRLQELDNYKLVAEESILFQFGSSVLTAEARQLLDAAAGRTAGRQRFVIEIQGFTDSTGVKNYNIELSQKRATAIVRYLNLNHKIPLHRLFATGLGSDAPVADNKTTAGRKQNRRVEVRLFSADPSESREAASLR